MPPLASLIMPGAVVLVNVGSALMHYSKKLACAALLENRGAQDQAICNDYKQQVDAFRERFADALHDDPATAGIDEAWYNADCSDWPSAQRPAIKADTDLTGAGIAWYRLDLALPDDWRDCDCTLELGLLDCQRQIWIDGVLKEHTTWDTPNFWMRPISIPFHSNDSLHIGLRACFQFCAGSAYGSQARICLRKKDGSKLRLENWHWKTECSYPETKPGQMDNGNIPWPKAQVSWGLSQPCTMFNALIAPIIPFSIDGVLWYQGESNCGRADQYQAIMRALIQDWRQRWQCTLPFGIVELAAWQQVPDKPVDEAIPYLREAQQLIAQHNQPAGLISAIDAGDANDIHPKNKKVLGERLAAWALKEHYACDATWQHPQFESLQVDQQRVVINIRHCYGNLQTRDQQAPRAFAVLSDDEQWVWAQATLQDQSISISHPDGKAIRGLRYAWSNNPDVNIVDQRDMPLLAFRVDHID